MLDFLKTISAVISNLFVAGLRTSETGMEGKPAILKEFRDKNRRKFLEYCDYRKKGHKKSPLRDRRGLGKVYISRFSGLRPCWPR